MLEGGNAASHLNLYARKLLSRILLFSDVSNVLSINDLTSLVLSHSLMLLLQTYDYDSIAIWFYCTTAGFLKSIFRILEILKFDFLIVIVIVIVMVP